MSTLALELRWAGADVDHDVLEGLRRRDPSAAERLVARFGSRAYRLAMGITRNAADAEEVVQDAFWSVIRKVDTFRGDAAFGSWIYRIVTNAAFQKMRAAVRRRAEISLDEVLPTFHEASADLRSALSAAVADLSPEYRAVVVLHDVEGLPMAEVAESAGITVANAKTRLHRARLFLRKRLAVFMEGTARR